jgi:hypothetical protein
MDQIDKFFEQDDEEPPETFREEFHQKPSGYNDNIFEDGKNAEHVVAFHETDHTTNASYMVSDRELSIEEFLHNDNNNKFSSRQNSFHHNENYVGENDQFIDHTPMHPGHEDDHISVNVKRKISLDDSELPSEIKLNKKIKSSDNAMTSAFNGRNALVNNEKVSSLNSCLQWAQISDQFFRSEVGLLDLQKKSTIQPNNEAKLSQPCLDYCDQDIDLFADGQNIHKCKKSIIQNYIAATSNGFAKMLSVYGTNKCSEFYAAIVASVQTLLLERGEFQNTQISPFVDLILKYTKDNIEGKVLKQTHKGKSWSQYKVSNKEEIHQIFHDQLNEDPTNRGIKRVLRELIVYFFHSKYYFEWVAEHYRTKKQENKKFFYDKENIEEMVRVYLNPHKCRSHFM